MLLSNYPMDYSNLFYIYSCGIPVTLQLDSISFYSIYGMINKPVVISILKINYNLKIFLITIMCC